MNGVHIHLAEGSPLPLPSPFIRFFPFADGGVLFAEGTRRVWGLNASAAFLWCSLDDIRRVEELAEALSEKFSLDETTAMRDTVATLACFEDEGTLGEGRPVDIPEEGSDWEIPSSALLLVEPESWAVKELFQTPRHVVELCSQDARLGKAFCSHMVHLSIERPQRVDTRLAILENGVKNTWDIYLNGRRFVEGASEEEVLPHLFTQIFVRTCGSLKEALLFHAAVIGSNEKTVLFPAEAGSGKSTLAAALAARGGRYFSDELAVLDVRSLRVAPFPMPMSIKAGSVEALRRYYPRLASGAVHHRADGKQVRYLSPPPASLAGVGNDTVSIDAIVYPIYLEGSETRLIPLAKIEALQRLAITGSSDRNFLSLDIEAMLALVERTPSFELVFSNLEEALELLDEQVYGNLS